jgi:hypothetical protein
MRSMMSSFIQSYGSAIVQAAISIAVSKPTMSLLEQLHTRRIDKESQEHNGRESRCHFELDGGVSATPPHPGVQLRT